MFVFSFEFVNIENRPSDTPPLPFMDNMERLPRIALPENETSASFKSREAKLPTLLFDCPVIKLVNWRSRTVSTSSRLKVSLEFCALQCAAAKHTASAIAREVLMD